MQPLDCLTWADGLAFSSFGVRIGIRVNQPGFRATLLDALPPGAAIIPAGPVHQRYSLIVNGTHQPDGNGPLHMLYEGSERLARQRDLAPVLKFLEARLRRTVAERAPRRVFVHAGVVAHRGRAIVIPGATMSGKSTLVCEFIKRGATYYSDEYAVLDAKGMVYPFAKPLSIRKPGAFDSIDYAAEHFGASIGVKPILVAMVVITHYVAGAKWRPRTLTQGQAALLLMAHAIAARRAPGRVMQSLRNAAEHARMLKGVRGEASDTVEKLLELLRSESEECSAAADFKIASRRR
jgi:hypothetical protein